MPSPGAIRAGAAYVELFTEDSRLVRGLQRAQRRLTAFGTAAMNIGTKAMAVGTMFALAFVPAIKAASDMEETMNKFNVVFGSNAAAVKQWGDTFAGEVGRSKQQVADFLAGTQDLLVPIGFEPGAATRMSKDLTRLAVDLASFNNMADAAVLRDLHAALTGSGEVMKKYGVLVNEAAVKQQLFREGIDPKRATDQQKVMARWNLILQGTTAAQGDAIRSAGSFANQMKALKAQIADTAVVVGSALLPVITPLVTQMAGAAQQVAVWVGEHEELVVTAAKVAAGLTLASGAVVGFGAVARTAATAVGLLSGALKGLRAVLALLVAHPVVAVIAGIGAAAIVAWGALRKLVASSKALRDSLSRAAQVAGQVWDTFTAAIRPALAELSAAIGEVLKPLEAVLADLLRTAGDVAAEFVIIGTEFARLGAVLLRHSGVIETITIGLRYLVNQLKVAAVATALMAGGVVAALDAVDALASAAGLSLDATASSATRAADALKKVKKEAAPESGGSAAPTTTPGTNAGTAARAAEEELRWARRVHQLRLEQIEDRFAREKALVNERYDHEIKQAQKAGATKKQLDDMERARALELAAVKQRQAVAEREQYNESSDRVSQLSVEVADLAAAGQHTGAARELAMLDRQRIEEELAVPWDSPNRDEEYRLIREKYRLKREAVTGATQQQYADETLRLQNELAGGTQFDRQRLHVSDELAKALKDTMGVIDPSIVRERFKLEFDLIDQREAEAAKARDRISTQGTFQGGVAWQALGVQTDSQRIVKATEQTAKGVENIHREQKHNKGPTFG